MDSMLSANEKEFYRNRYSVGNFAEGTQITRNASYANPTKQVRFTLLVVLLRVGPGLKRKRE